eukprot:gene13653-13776_t
MPPCCCSCRSLSSPGVASEGPPSPAGTTGSSGSASSSSPESSGGSTTSINSTSAGYDPAELTKGAPSRHLWLGNLHQRLPRSLVRGVFEKFGPVEDVVTFPGRMYAFVNYKEAADAAKAAEAVQV